VRKGTGRVPSARVSALLAALMLGIGAAVGAAVGPGPESSLAGSSAGALAQRLPLLLAAIEARDRAASNSTTASSAPAAAEAPAAEAALLRHRKARTVASSTPAATPASSSGTPSESTSSSPSSSEAPTKKLPPVTTVWLIQLSGASFSAALAQPSGAPYIDGQAIPGGTLLSGWSALEGSAFANDAALAEPPPAGAAPPLLHSIVQPPCPEGAAGAACAPETPGQLQAADQFLKETLATITTTPAYREHGLVVVTFASVALATQAGLAAGTSSATLTAEPPAGVLLLSPFARAGARSANAFAPTSPRRSLEALLR